MTQPTLEAAPVAAQPTVPGYYTVPPEVLASLVPGRPVPPSIGGQILLQKYHQTQQQIGQRAGRAISGLWDQHITPEHFMNSWEGIYPVVNGIVDTHYDMSAANASEFYTHSRALLGHSPVNVPSPHLAPSYLNNVTGMMGPGQFFHFLKEQDAGQSASMAKDALSGASARLVLKGGRDTITTAAINDPLAQGWERIIEPGACGFCAMLAGRGGVYSAKGVNFRAHDNCHCVARPVFQGQTSVNKDIGDEWASATKGKRGAAARAAWDQYWSAKNVEPDSGTAPAPQGARAGHAAIGQQ
jgi:hypothetical protein